MNKSLAHCNCLALQEHVALLEDMSDDLFRYTREPVFPSPIGSHLRHDLDHYLSFLRGLPDGQIDYESRERDPQLETDRIYALETVHAIIEGLNTLPPDGGQALEVRVEQDEDIEITPSTLRRELDFLLSHTIHHQAIISMMVRDSGAKLSPNYGVAPSTLRFLRQTSCAP